MTRLSLIFAVVFSFLPFQSHSAVLQLDAAGEVIGATDVELLGGLWDVVFINGHCPDLFDGCETAEDFDFQTAEDAAAASRAIMEQVLLDGPQGQFDSQPHLTRGCSDLFLCGVITLFGFDELGWYAGGVARNDFMESGDSWDLVNYFHPDLDSTVVPYGTVAMWTRTASVPAPATVLLFLLALCPLLQLNSRRLS
jgi:hypothetical protein